MLIGAYQLDVLGLMVQCIIKLLVNVTRGIRELKAFDTAVRKDWKVRIFEKSRLGLRDENENIL